MERAKIWRIFFLNSAVNAIRGGSREAIERDRQLRKFETTRQLAELIERISPRAGKKAHPATKVFQAIADRGE